MLTVTHAGAGAPSAPGYWVPILGHALDVVEALVRAGPQRLQALSLRTGISKTSVFRILATLCARGYVVKDLTSGLYAPGPALSSLGRAGLGDSSLVERARPVLQLLRERFDETVNLAQLAGDHIVYVAVEESRQRFRVSATVGEDGPPHLTACGRAILAFSPRPVVQRLLGKGPLRRATAHSLTTRAQLFRLLDDVRARGLAVDAGETEAGATCIAVPLLDSNGNAGHALSVSGPSARMAAIIPEIEAALLRVGRELSFSPLPSQVKRARTVGRETP